MEKMRTTIKKMKLYEPGEFIYIFLRERLTFTPTDRPVALHITCSMRRMGLADTIVALARLCSTQPSPLTSSEASPSTGASITSSTNIKI